MRVGPSSHAGGRSAVGRDARGDGNARRFLLRRIVVAVFVLWAATSLAFFAIHLGPRNPADMSVDEHTASGDADADALEERKRAFGLTQPLHVQYGDYLADTFTFDFGESYTSRASFGTKRLEPITDLNVLLERKLLPRTAWLWAWSLVVAATLGVPVGVALGYADASWAEPSARVSSALMKAAAVFLLLTAIRTSLSYSQELLFGFDWMRFVVEIDTLQDPIELRGLDDPTVFARAVKRVLPGAVAIGVALAAPFVRVGERAVRSVREARTGLGVANGVGRLARVRRVLREAAVPLASVLSASVALLVGATLFVEIHMDYGGVGQTFVRAVGHGDYTTAQAIAFLFVLVVVVARVLEAVLVVWLVGAPADREDAAARYWTGLRDGWGEWARERHERLDALPVLPSTDAVGRLRATPRPAVAWVAAGVVLLAPEAGAVLDVIALVPHAPALPEVPTLLSRDVVPNMGHRSPDGGGWTGTAFGLPPAYAWTLRVALVYAYATAWVAWAWLGYRLYAAVYRETDRTPVDEALRRFRRSNWATLGAIVVAGFVVAAVFGPALGPTTFERIGEDPGQEERVTYLQDGIVRETSVAVANMHTESRGREDAHVGALSYDQYSRFHPTGTTYHGSDLFTNMLYGVRTYVLVGAVTASVASALAFATGLAATGGGRLAGAAGSLGVEAAAGVPLLPFAFLVVEQFEPWMPNQTVGSLAMATAFGVLALPSLARTLHGPLGARRNHGRVRAALAFGEGNATAVRRHVLPRVVGHAVSYAVLVALGAMIAHTTVSALWGGSVHYVRGGLGPLIGQHFATMSGHVDVYPLLATLALFVGLYALADGIRRAVDPTAAAGVAAPGEVAASGEAG